MISPLHIKNIGIIEDITINLEDGFNVLTGETGAGKSLIIVLREIYLI
jgi:DNA repair protein RecN (Recombination protein N)